MKILIGADIVPTKSNIEAFSNGNTNEIIDKSLEKELSGGRFQDFQS